MIARWLAISLLVFFAVAVSSQDSAPPEGKITGTVLDDQDRPVKGAQVCVYLSPGGEVVKSCLAPTDETGQFEIDHMPMGTVRLAAEMPGEGSADTDNPDMQGVVLTVDVPTGSVELRLTSKQGLLVPAVKDKKTGQPIDDFAVSWHVVSGDRTGPAGTAEFNHSRTEAPIPAERDVVIDSVSARGHKKLVCASPPSPCQEAPLNLQPGERRSLVVELEPQAKVATQQ